MSLSSSSLKLIISTLVVFGCEPVGGTTACIVNAHCNPTEVCQNGFCIDPCINIGCRDPNAVCLVVYQVPKCECKSGFVLGRSGCEPECLRTSPSGSVRCTDNAQCRPNACENGFCIDPCINKDCRDPNALCLVSYQMPKCECKSGFVLGRNGCEPECLRTSPSGFAKCTYDTHCSLAEACEYGVCINPCKTTYCGDPNSACVSWEHKSKCVCKYGFELGTNHCKPENSCTVDAQCKPTEACQNGFCVDLCINKDCRDPNALCVVLNQMPKCECKSGFVLGKCGCESEESTSTSRFVYVELGLPWEEARTYCSDRGMKLATVENAGKKSELEHFIRKIGNKVHKTPQSGSYVYYPLPSRRLKFEIQATIGECHLAFSKKKVYSEKPIVEVSVGSNQNKRVTINKNHASVILHKNYPDLVDPYNFRLFWIDFGRVYRLGKENEETPLITWEDPEPFYANYLGVYSGWGSNAIWSFYGETVFTDKDQSKNNSFYTPLPQLSLDIAVRANEGVQISLTSGPQDTSPMYEIILGGWGNTASAIRYQQSDKVRVNTPGLLSAGEDRRFRISWNDGLVKVLKQSGELVMKWQNEEYVEITHYGLMSPRGEASWGVIVTDDVNGLATTGRLWLGGVRRRTMFDQYKWLVSGQAITSDWYTGELLKGWIKATHDSGGVLGPCVSTAPLMFGLDGALKQLQWFKTDCFIKFKFICERTVNDVCNH